MRRHHYIALFIFILIMLILGGICGTALQLATKPQAMQHTGTVAPANPASPARYVPATPPPTPTPTPLPNRPVAVSTGTRALPSSAPAIYRNRVIGPGVNVVIVGTYTDCTGKAAVGWNGAYFDSCFPAPWIMAHPTFFGAMNSWGVGTAVTWWDGNGTAHLYHIIDVTVYPSGSSGVRVDGTAHFQVCTQNISNSPVRVLNAA